MSNSIIVKLYVDVDENGRITVSVVGPNIVPSREYDYYFEVEGWEIPQNIHLYRVVNGELVYDPEDEGGDESGNCDEMDD